MFTWWEFLATITLIWGGATGYDYLLAWREYKEWGRDWSQVTSKWHLGGELVIALVLIFLTWWAR